MTETIKTENLFRTLYEGNNWLDVGLLPVLSGLTYQDALKRISPKSNSIWEIVNHLIAWRENVLHRINGKVLISPGNNYLEEVKDTSEDAWKSVLHKLEVSQQNWLKHLNKMSMESVDLIYGPNGLNYFEHIHGIMQHDAYHMGQIVLLSKYL